MMAPKIAMSGVVNILQQKKPLSNYFATLLPAFVTMIFFTRCTQEKNSGCLKCCLN